MFKQLDLFENKNLVSGINSLNELKWEEGVQFLRKAKVFQEEDKIYIEKGIETAIYWREKLEGLNEEEQIQNTLKEVLVAYKEFEFVNRLETVRKEIGRCLVDQWIVKGDLDYDLTIQLFTLLMKNADYGYSEKLIAAYLQKSNSKRLKIYYLLGQTEWFQGHEGRAKKHYLQAFLYYPDRLMLHYVKSKELKALAERYPLYLVPAYAWLEGKAHFVTTEDSFQAFDEKHETALKAYNLLKECHTALKAKKDPLPYRKELKKISPEIFEVYLRNLRKDS